MARLKVFDPDCVSIYDIEMLINNGIRFDIISGLEPEEYDELEDFKTNGETILYQRRG